MFIFNYLYNFYNSDILILYLGGICTFFLLAWIIYAKREFARTQERARLQRFPSETTGDIEANLDDSYEFKKINIIELMTEHSLQPLFIINFINLFDSPLEIEKFVIIVLVILIIGHEFWMAKLYSSNRKYQIFMVILWIVLFMITSYKKNMVEIEKHKLDHISQVVPTNYQ